MNDNLAEAFLAEQTRCRYLMDHTERDLATEINRRTQA